MISPMTTALLTYATSRDVGKNWAIATRKFQRLFSPKKKPLPTISPNLEGGGQTVECG